ncbi:phosphatidate cytidylyltransferase [Shimia ponticola]|uniref:phosphatidate cytidylyltransferase n=1 Tax=Shimia ponticola TaxID=2582893 RepID=UPI0011BD4492|nr:phosphatidate cytidylyltransferase [Shimia ponticola]
MSSPKWDDLRQRLVSGVALAVTGLVAVTLGGVWFQMLTVFVTAVMVWELWMMIRPEAPTEGMLLAALVASILSGLLTVPGVALLPLILLPAIGGAALLRRERLTFLGFAIGIMIAGWGLVTFRETYGVVWIFWLVLVVAVTDIAGYFAGRMIGGPKFWPRLSPKKTWSGTVAGWVGAAALGAVFLSFTTAGRDLIWISVLVSFASQMGDITESALKRRMGVKDSSALIPGHGGLFDRFDGLLGASLVMLAAALVVDVPQVDF